MHQTYSSTHYCPKRLQDMTNVVHHALTKHQSVTLYRFDVRFPVIAEDVQDNVLFGKAIMIAATHHSKNRQERIIKMLNYLAKRHHSFPGQRCWGKAISTLNL